MSQYHMHNYTQQAESLRGDINISALSTPNFGGPVPSGSMTTMCSTIIKRHLRKENWNVTCIPRAALLQTNCQVHPKVSHFQLMFCKKFCTSNCQGFLFVGDLHKTRPKLENRPAKQKPTGLLVIVAVVHYGKYSARLSANANYFVT